MGKLLVLISVILSGNVAAQVCVSGLDNLPAYPLMEKVVFCAHDLTTPIGLCRYSYDKHQRLTTEIRCSYASDTAVKQVREFRYNDKGQLSSTKQYELKNLDTSRIILTVFKYDEKGRHIGERTEGRIVTNLEIQYEGEKVRRRIESSPVWKYVMRYEYDSLGRLSRRIWDQGSFVQYQYEGKYLVREELFDRASTIYYEYHYSGEGVLAKEDRHHYDPLECFGACNDQVTVMYYSVH